MAPVVFSLLIAFATTLAIAAGRGRRNQSPLDFFVASRQLTTIAVFCLAAAESYGIGTLIGFSAGVYSNGAAYGVWYIGYLLLAYPIGYFLLPHLWRMGKQYEAITLPDLIKGYFQSRTFELVVAIGSIAFLVPWGQLQLIGLIIAVRALGLNLPPIVVIAFATALAFLFVIIAGMRSSSRIAMLKDLLLLIVIVATGISAVTAAGGVGPLFDAGGIRIRATLTDEEINFAISTIVFQALGLYLIPLAPQAIFSAKDPVALRRAHIFMPLYMLLFPFLIAAAYYAASRPALAVTPSDTFLVTALQTLPAWALGLVAAATALTSMFVLAGTCLAIAPIVVRNVVPSLPVARQTRMARLTITLFLVVVVALLPIATPVMIRLVNITYVGATQFVPTVAVALLGIRVLPTALISGVVCSLAFAVTGVALNWTFAGVNIGAISLGLNVAVVCALHAFTRRRGRAALVQRRTF
ncbi:sodium:solute symporter [Pandoraea anapnoica]|uniref:Sodium:solute symporter n=1 Tax=Pandoraea anapnoica TaxID=2508301 RepID=A0A5E5AMR6_9BURK|nr:MULTISPECIES: sodium:solute symporter family protein [Pandoraea]VVE58683.1 sodium:solute symporter [Pandoraea iniqua]VVE74989.1 sodium:solute symporter [Pandoraea anapnoica]